MTLMAYGVGAGDAVITTAFSFIATAEVIELCGATPVFVDIDPETFNIDPKKIPDAVEKARSKGLKPKGIITVDIFGLPADYDAINSYAKSEGLFVLGDAAQSFGAIYKGRKVGTLADVTATSFYPSKPLGCYGDGGAVFTDDDGLAETLISIRVHGMGKNQYDNVRVGINGRMDTIQAAILLSKLTIFDDEVQARRKVAETYTERLAGAVKVQSVPNDARCAWAQYGVISDNKDEIVAALKDDGIPTSVYYPKPLHLQKVFERLGYREGDMAVSENISRGIFCLPMHPYLMNGEIQKVTDAVRRCAI